MNIFSHYDCRDCVEALLSHHLGRGGKVKLAQWLNCQPGYISQVLGKSKIHFSPENLVKISKQFSLNENEEEFLLMLLYHERAGSQESKNFYALKIQKFKREFLNVEKQIKDINQELDDLAKAIYYSHWAYSAIHLLVSIPGFQTAETISQKLKLGASFTNKVLAFLEDKGLVFKDAKGLLAIGKTRIHLKKDSPLFKAHHQNYRQKAMLSLEEENDFDLHYSGALTPSKKGALKIRELVLKLIADNEKILIPSANEEMIGLNLDLFRF